MQCNAMRASGVEPWPTTDPSPWEQHARLPTRPGTLPPQGTSRGVRTTHPIGSRPDMHWRRSLMVMLVTVLAPAALSSAADEAHPNLVLIVADDLGWADLGCYGSRFHRTPHLD